MLKKISKLKYSPNEYISGEKSQFFLMFVITYLITIAISAIIALNSLDDEIAKYTTLYGNTNVNLNSLMDALSILDGRLEFYNCKNLTVQLYFVAKMTETLVPTTITFCGTILVLQKREKLNERLNTVLFCFLICLTVAGIASTEVQNIGMLRLYIRVIICSCLFCVLYSRKIHILQNLEGITNSHKQERSDGNIIRN